MMKKSLKTLALTSFSLLTLTACGINLPSVEQLLSKDKAATPASSQVTPASTTPASSTPVAAQATVSQEDAVKSALALLGVAEDQVSNLVVTQETEDGKPVYDISFIHEEMEYDYTIDAQTGQAIEKEAEQTSAAAPVAPAAQTADVALSSQEATEVAFADFAQVYGVGSDAVSNLLVQASTEDGRPSYEVSFIYGAYEFDYEIDAQTGSIIGFSEDDLD